MNDSIYEIDQEGFLEFKPTFFQNCMAEFLDEPTLRVLAVKFLGQVGVTATTRMKYTGEQDKLLGLFHYEITYESQHKKQSVEILVKSKTHYCELIHRLANVLVQSGIQLNNLSDLLAQTGLFNAHKKEINVYKLTKTQPQIKKILPKVYGVYVNDEKGQYIVLEKFLQNSYLIQDYTDIAFWNKEMIDAAVKNFIEMHSAFYDNYQSILTAGWLGDIFNAQRMTDLKPLWLAYAEKLKEYYLGNLFSPKEIDEHFRWIETIPTWWGKIDQMKKTLIYNDAQIRNLAVRNPNTKPQLCLFDWEVPIIQLPQRDLIEFLSYVISDRITDKDIIEIVDASGQHLEKISNIQIDPTEWRRGFLYANYDYHINRMACQLVLHKTLNRPDIERVFRASMRLLTILHKNNGYQ